MIDKCKKNNFIAVFSIIVSGFIVYGNSLNNGFVYDDALVVENNYFLTSWSNLRYFFNDLYFSGSGEASWRPLVTLTYFFDYWLGAGRPFFYHLTNVICHLLSGVFFYYLVFNLILLLDSELPSFKTAFLCALFFVIHPIHTEAVNAIAFREDILSALFCFLSLLFYLKSKFGLNKRRVFYVFSLLCYFFALLSKEAALPLIFIILFVDFFCQKDKKCISNERKMNFVSYAGYIGVIFLYAYFRFFLIVRHQAPFAALEGVNYAGGSLYTAFLTNGRIFTAYLILLFFPLKLSTEHYFRYFVDPSYSFLESRVLFSFAILCLVLFLIIGSFRDRKIFTFCGLWFFIFFSTTANILPLDHPMAERYLYLPCAGFCLFLSVLAVKLFYFRRNKFIPLENIPRQTAWYSLTGFIQSGVVVATVIILIFYSFRTISRNKVWKDSFTFWSEAVKSPFVSDRAYNCLGTVYSGKKMPEEAIKLYKKAIQACPDYADAYNNLGNQYINKGLYAKAEQCYQRAIEIYPFFFEAYNNLGALYHRQGFFDKAIKQYQKTLEINPFFNVYSNLGHIYYRKGLLDEAVVQYEKSLTMDSRLPQVWLNLGSIYFKKGLYDKAEGVWREGLKLNPDYFPLSQILERYYNNKDVFKNFS